jgi:ribonuclease HI
MAAIRALEVLNKQQEPTLDDADEVKLYSDSRYVVDGITSWILKWRAVHWSARVLNKDLWQRLDKLVLAVPYRLQWQHVSAHSGIAGNEAADRLAKAGALLLMQEVAEKHAPVVQIK